MSSALAQVCWVFFFLVAPGLLTIRYFRPRFLPRWGVLLAAALLGGAVFYLREMLVLADMMEAMQGYRGFPPPVPNLGDGMVSLRGPYKSDFILGAVLQLVYLLLWLVPYGIFRIVRTRMRQAPQASA